MKLVFWILFFCVIYSYFIYPLVLLLVRQIRPRDTDQNTQELGLPPLSLIITAHNEEKRIRQKLENALSVDYDSALLEIIVASDASTDATDAVVKEYKDRGVILVRPEERLGKENAQLSAIKEARGDILVFSDVATEMEKDALTKLVCHFANSAVGAVSSEDRFVSQSGEVAGEGAYVKYEMWLRKLESGLGGIVGLSGSFFAARKDVCRNWDIYSPSDFNTALNCAKLGLRAVTAADVLGYYQDLKDPSKEYARKVRTVIRGITGLFRHPEVLNVFKYKLFAFQVFSHKLMRWLVPWFLILFFIASSVLISAGGFFVLAFWGQIAFYAATLLAHYSQSARKISFIKIIYFFVQVNIAIFDASCRYLAGTRMTVWNPSAR